MDYTKEFLSKLVTPTLTVGGGLIGTGADLVTGPLGTLGGAALGNMAGKSIENMYTGDDSSNLPEAGLQGATSQALGSIGGKVIGDALKGLKIEIPTISEEPPVVEPVPTYHGSNQEIPDPLSNYSKTGMYGDNFMTAPPKGVANTYGLVRAQRLGGVPTINKYYTREGVPTFTVTEENLPYINKILGITEEEAARDMGTYPGYAQSIVNAARKHDVYPMTMGRILSDRLKGEGYRRMILPLEGYGEQVMQHANYSPETDLIYGPEYDAMKSAFEASKTANQSAIDNNSLVDKAIPISDRMIRILSTQNKDKK